MRKNITICVFILSSIVCFPVIAQEAENSEIACYGILGARVNPLTVIIGFRNDSNREIKAFRITLNVLDDFDEVSSSETVECSSRTRFYDIDENSESKIVDFRFNPGDEIYYVIIDPYFGVPNFAETNKAYIASYDEKEVHKQNLTLYLLSILLYLKTTFHHINQFSIVLYFQESLF